MRSTPRPWRRFLTRFPAGLAAPALLALGPWAAAAEPTKGAAPAPLVVEAAATVPPLDLAACRRLALEKQPAIGAAVGSLGAAQARAHGLDSQRGIPLVTRDLPVRRQQACLGVSIAQAQVELARQETLYNVTRTYFTAVFARQQLRTVDDAIASLKVLRKDIAELENWNVEQIDVFLQVAAGRREGAVQGYRRAVAALREAMGVGDAYPCFDGADAELPRPVVTPCGDDIVRLALTRRGEIAQAALFAEVTNHEIKAQSTKLLHPTVRTFASGSDIHARQVPQGSRGPEYSPGGLVPEMPTILVGSRSARLEQARAYHARADSVVDKTRNLITLEAQDAFLRWEEDAVKLPPFEAAAGAAAKLADKLGKEAKKPGLSNVTPADASNARALATQLRVQANETHFQLLLDLAALERVTAGGFTVFEAPMHP